MKYKHFKMGTTRQKLHRVIYNKLIKLGVDSGKAYNVASRITHWA